jgi:hypothetical protein
MNDTDYSKYYDLEGYLFGEVSSRYQQTKRVNAFDFFCIVVWKANRAKSKVANRLLAHGHANLTQAVESLIDAISAAPDHMERLRVLVQDWGFRLPMASAILTVLFPKDFTVYDVRVCEALNNFKGAQYKTRFDRLWEQYSEYIKRVKASVGGEKTLRDKDRYLWGRSFQSELETDIANCFHGTSPNQAGPRAPAPST